MSNQVIIDILDEINEPLSSLQFILSLENPAEDSFLNILYVNLDNVYQLCVGSNPEQNINEIQRLYNPLKNQIKYLYAAAYTRIKYPSISTEAIIQILIENNIAPQSKNPQSPTPIPDNIHIYFQTYVLNQLSNSNSNPSSNKPTFIPPAPLSSPIQDKVITTTVNTTTLSKPTTTSSKTLSSLPDKIPPNPPEPKSIEQDLLEMRMKKLGII
jgi:hypothetical protein